MKTQKTAYWLKILTALCAFMLLAGCNGDDAEPPTISGFHSPLHPSNTETVTFRGEAAGDVDRVVLAYDLYSLSGPETAKVQTLVESDVEVETCDPADVVDTLTCEHTMSSAFPTNSLIVFKATAFNSDGDSAEESYSFAAGDYPWPNDPIPVRAKGGFNAKFDIVFIPDTDMTVAGFRDNLDEVVETLYFKYDLIKENRALFNFYYSGVQGNYEETCNFANPSNMASLTAVADTVAFLHQTNLRDCRSGIRMSSEINYDKTLIHETGHALFGLQDEYCCDSSYTQHPQVPNIWSALAGCQSEASDVGHPASNCTQISKGTNSINFWYIDPTGPNGSIMGSSQHNAGSDFGKAGQRRINWRYQQCFAGNCFQITPESAELETIITAADAQNTFDVAQFSLLPQLVVEIELSAEGIQPIDSTIIYLPYQSDNELQKSLTARFMAGDNVVNEYAILDPRRVEFEDQVYDTLELATTFVYTPLSGDLSELVVEAIPGEGQGELPIPEIIDLSLLVQQACEEQPDLEECQ